MLINMVENEKFEDVSDDVIDIHFIMNNFKNGILRFGWIIIVFAIISSGIVCLKMKYDYNPRYIAAATFAVNLNLESNGTIYEDNLRASQMSATFPYIITSGVLKNIIAVDLGVESVSESITAENIEGTNLFTIRVVANEAKWAYLVLQSVIKSYPTVAEMVVGSTYLSMIEESGVPKEPSNSPNYLGIIELGALPGAAIGVIILLFYAVTRRTIYRNSDFIKLSSIKHLGTLPKVLFKRRSKEIMNITILNDKLVSYREDIYRIRTRVEKISAAKKMKSILITSAVPSEGKSTVALNLALAFAQGGKNVILVDCDLYRPSIKNMLSLEEEFQGLEKVLAGETKLTDAIRYIDEMKLSVLACSKPVDHSAEIMGTEKIHNILAELEASFDYVILDTAPSAILSDTADLAKHVDGAIYVIKQDYAKVNHILDGLEHLSESSNIDIIGFVFNCVRVGIGSYGYGYGYGKYGHYGHGKKKHAEELLLEE